MSRWRIALALVAAASASLVLSTAAEPVILEEVNPRGGAIHVYVVWSVWPNFPREQRGEIIMDAAEEVKPKDELLRITVAMGLTPDEADRFGINWR